MCVDLTLQAILQENAAVTLPRVRLVRAMGAGVLLSAYLLSQIVGYLCSDFVVFPPEVTVVALDLVLRLRVDDDEIVDVDGVVESIMLSGKIDLPGRYVHL